MGEATAMVVTVTDDEALLPGCPWAGEDRAICIGNGVLLGCPETTGSEGYCYRWLPEEGLDTPHDRTTWAYPTQTTIYTLYVTDDQGNLIASDEVTVSLPLTAMVVPEDTDICPGESATMEVIVSGGSANLTYLWKTGETTPSITVTPDAGGDYYWVKVYDQESGCMVKTGGTVDHKITPDINIFSTAATICELAMPGFTSGQGSGSRTEGACDRTSAYLYAGNLGYSYLWSTGATSNSITVDAAGVYGVTVSNPNNECIEVGTYEVISCVEVSIIPGVSLNGENILDAGSDYVSYHWHDGSTGQTISITDPGAYSVTVVNEDGCTGKGSYIIDEYTNNSADVFLALLVLDYDNWNRNIYISNSAASSISATDKERIQTKIATYLPKGALPGELPFTLHFFWTSTPMHDNLYPIDKYSSGSDIWLFPMVIKKYTDNITNATDWYLYYRYSDNNSPHYSFKLTATGDLQEYFVNLGDNTKFFTINLVNGPALLKTQLSIKSPDPDNTYTQTTVMDITFKAPPATEPNPYILFYDNAIAQPVININEGTSLPFQIKRSLGNNQFSDITNELAPNGIIQEIRWYENSIVKIPWNDETEINYLAPAFEVGGNNMKAINIEIKVVNQPGQPPVIYTLSVIVNIQEAPVNPGYFTNDNYSSFPNTCKGGTPISYVDIAKSRISENPADMVMYTELINNRQIDIVLTTTNDPEYHRIKPPGDGVLYGWADMRLIVDRRVHIDKELFDDPQTASIIEGTVYGQGPKYKKCPINTRLMLNISQEDEPGQLSEASQIRNIISMPVSDFEDAPQVVKDIVMRIATVYPDRAELLRTLCTDIDGNMTENLDQFNELNSGKKFAYYATSEELDNLIQIPDKASIYLVVDNLCSVYNYTEACPPPNTVFDHNAGERLKTWYTNTGEPTIAGNLSLQKARRDYYTSTLAHEMGHLYYKIQNKIDAYKWSLMINEFDIFKEDRCYPARNGGSHGDYCSEAGGHEHDNRDGFFSCDIDGHYPKAGCVIID